MSEASRKQMRAATDAVKGTEAAPVPVSAPRPKVGNVAAGISPNAHAKAEKRPVVVNDAFDYDVAFNFAFIGTGQGGGRIANAFYSLGYRRVAAFNTTDQDFQDLAPAMLKHSLDVGGASKDTQLALQSLRGREEEVRDLMTRAWGPDIDYAFICVGAGGGTGSGTAPELVKIARRYMEDHQRPVRVGAIVSLPPVTEGYQVCRNAVTGFKQLLELGVSPLIIIDNARIHELYSPPMARLHATSNTTVSQLLHLFNQLAAVHSQYITFDRSELAQLFDSGLVVMGAADVQKIDTPADVSGAIRDQLTNNVLAKVDLRTGKKAACLFVGDQDVLGRLDLSFFDAGFTQLDRTLHEGSVVHRGLYLGSEPGLQVYTMISELQLPRERLIELAKKGGLYESGSGQSSVAVFLGL